MSLDAILVADTRAWLLKAEADLRAAHVSLEAQPPLHEHSAFNCQQAAEKALKGFLTWHDLPFRKTHDLALLGAACSKLDPSLEPACKRADDLSAYAWEFRYPRVGDELTSEQVVEALSIARSLYDAIIARLPEEVRP